MPLPVDEVRDLCPHFSDEPRAMQLVDSRTQTLASHPQSTLLLSTGCGKQAQAEGGSRHPGEDMNWPC